MTNRERAERDLGEDFMKACAEASYREKLANLKVHNYVRAQEVGAKAESDLGREILRMFGAFVALLALLVTVGWFLVKVAGPFLSRAFH